MKSPIKDPTADFSKLASTVNEMVGTSKKINSYLLFGGALESALCNQGHQVSAHTSRYFVYEFWQCLLHNPRRIHDLLNSEFFKFDQNLFPILQKNWHTYADPFLRAAFFYALNRGSDTGQISSGEITNNDFNIIASNRLKRFKLDNFSVDWDQTDEWHESILNHTSEDEFLLLPVGRFSYNLSDYGKNRGPETTVVNHRHLAHLLEGVSCPWIVLYRHHPQLLKLYERYQIRCFDQYGEVTHSSNQKSDVIIANF